MLQLRESQVLLNFVSFLPPTFCKTPDALVTMPPIKKQIPKPHWSIVVHINQSPIPSYPLQFWSNLWNDAARKLSILPHLLVNLFQLL